MDVIIVTNASAEEIAALAEGLQERREIDEPEEKKLPRYVPVYKDGRVTIELR